MTPLAGYEKSGEDINVVQEVIVIRLLNPNLHPHGQRFHPDLLASLFSQVYLKAIHPRDIILLFNL